MSSSSFPTDWKYADIRPDFKKDCKADKENYRSISIVLNIGKVYDRLMKDQLYPYFNEIFSKLQCGFCKSYNVEQCLISLIEKLREDHDVSDHTGVLKTDLSKSFDCTDHELLLANPNTHGLDNRSLYPLFSHLENTKQRTKINSSHSTFEKILSVILQGLY